MTARFPVAPLDATHAHIECRPLQVNLCSVIQQPLRKEGINDENALIEMSPCLRKNGARHILAHTDVSNADCPRFENHAHRQTIYKQRWLGICSEGVLQAQINIERSQLLVSPGR